MFSKSSDRVFSKSSGGYSDSMFSKSSGRMFSKSSGGDSAIICSPRAVIICSPRAAIVHSPSSDHYYHNDEQVFSKS